MVDLGGIGNPTSSAPPFSVRLLAYENEHNASRQDGDQLLALLPASYRKEAGDLGTTGLDVTACVERELDLQRLANIQDWLWVAGLPLPPRALHHQLLLGREIFITEQIDMHMVWTAGRIFIKPIPRFLLEPDFWAAYLICAGECGCASGTNSFQAATQEQCRRRVLRQRALGFLYSYAALLSHESDFRIA